MFADTSPVLRRPFHLALLAVAAFFGMTGQAAAALVWNWSYTGAGIAASGTFYTVETPDSSGYYLITGITGTHNSEVITSLQPAGTAIPGNEPYAVDNLVSRDGQQLTGNGFGYSTSGGNYSNPFFADFLAVPGYLEFFSSPSVPSNSELPVSFSATLVSVPVPQAYALMLSGLAVVSFAARSRTTRQYRRT